MAKKILTLLKHRALARELMTERPLRILISGGGTGGYIFPALSIAAALERRFPGCEILFVGADNRMEMTRVPAAGYKIEGLPVAGFYRTKIWRNFGVLWKLFRSMLKARRIVRQFHPDVAVGVGGYASGPTLKAAQRRGVPTVLQEQNSYAGVTNRLLAKKADAICVAYEDMERFFPADKIIITGNPVRKALSECTLTPQEARKSLGMNPDRPLLLVVGGSLGARTLNNAMGAALTDGSAAKAPFDILWQTGKTDYERCAALAAEHPAPNVKVTEFISDMGAAYRAATVIVSRAGAGTISELQDLGKASILVPSPNVTEDHQRHNAEALASRDAAVMVLDADAPEKLWPEACALMADADRIHAMERKVSDMALREADEKIVEAIVAALHAEVES